MTARLELLPAVDVADGQRRPPRPGRGRQRDHLRRPARGRARLAGRPAPSGSTSSTSTPRSAAARTPSCSPRSSARLGRRRSSCPAASATTPSLEAALATGCARVNLGTAALENPDWTAAPSPRTATGSPSASTCAARPSPPAAGPRRAATSGRRSTASTPTAAPGTSSPTSPRTARSAGPTSTCCARSARRTDRPVVASGGVSSLDDLEALRGLVPTGVEGAIVGKALYAGAFTLAAGAGRRGRPCTEPRGRTGRLRRRPLGRPQPAPPSRFAGDDGSADPAARRRAGSRGRRRRRGRPRRRPRARAGRRGPRGRAGAGRPRTDGRSTRAPTWPWPPSSAPDGRRALPVFTSSDALAAWDAAARPVPAEGPRAALSAVAGRLRRARRRPGRPRHRRGPAARAVGARPGPCLDACRTRDPEAVSAVRAAVADRRVRWPPSRLGASGPGSSSPSGPAWTPPRWPSSLDAVRVAARRPPRLLAERVEALALRPGLTPHPHGDQGIPSGSRTCPRLITARQAEETGGNSSRSTLRLSALCP